MSKPNHSASLFLALRFLRPKRNFVSVITVISVLGVTLGVWILAGVVAVMTGYSETMREKVLGFEAHLTIQQGGVLWDWPQVVDTVAQNPRVTDALPFSRGQVALEYERELEVVQLQGLDPRPGPMEERLKRLIDRDEEGVRRGEFDLDGDYAVIGKALAERFGIGLGDLIVLHSLANGRELLDSQRTGEQPKELIFPVELEVTGIFDSGRHNYDRELVFVPLEAGQRMYNLGAGSHGVAVQIEDPYEVEWVKDELLDTLEPPLNVMSWIDRNQELFDMVAMERLVMYILLFVIMIVAGFCMVNTMITVTSQKRKEIGLMKAMGARMDQTVGVFLSLGLAVGALGVTLGLGLAFFTLSIRQNLLQLVRTIMGSDVFSSEVYELYELPAQITMMDVVVISASALLACAFSSLFPAYMAARLDAAKALRNEGVS